MSLVGLKVKKEKEKKTAPAKKDVTKKDAKGYSQTRLSHPDCVCNSVTLCL